MAASAPARPLVLVVEDDEGLRALWTTVLENMGCAVAAFEDGADACRAMATFEPQLILLDLVMPRAELDGFDVLMRIGESGVPIVVVSALSDTLGATLSSRVAAVLPKPVSVYVLIQEVTRVLAEAGSTVQG